MAGETIAEGSSNEALITIWLPRRSLSALAGQALLIVAALLVVLGSLGGDLPLLFHGLGISLGLEISVLGANCLNFAYWYPIAWTKYESLGQQPDDLTDGQRLMIRVNIVFQFCGCMAVILLQGILAGLMLLTPVNKQDATLNNLGVFLGTLPILLGGILDYILAHNAYLIPWPPTIDVQVSRTFRGHEHSAWLTILKAAREAYKLVIAFVVLSLIGGLVIAVGNVVLLIGVTAIIALLGLPMLWCEILEARHLFRTQTDRR